LFGELEPHGSNDLVVFLLEIVVLGSTPHEREQGDEHRRVMNVRLDVRSERGRKLALPRAAS